ncbi:hypothetical protein E2C01_083226 [Portunus trituberculatus]|uniref:Uncharacterized protein n=1 Tax=Portunus trituberculatus TaxID=210409 RepID=A0A5B7J0M0_PORTR|nr:hypothetical protein [Portunus trituberculatus]
MCTRGVTKVLQCGRSREP